MEGIKQNNYVIILDDLATRFLLNTPLEEEELTPIRLFFIIEEAWWYYIDHYRPKDPQLPEKKHYHFTNDFVKQCKALSHLQTKVSSLFSEFKHYKKFAQVYGAIILNETLDKCLLVRGFRKSESWSFPRGKADRDESEADCAIREVIEETGFNIKPYLVKDLFIETKVDRYIKLFLIPKIAESTKFSPQTNNEIKEVSWHVVDEITRNPKQDRYFLISSAIQPLVEKIQLLKQQLGITSITNNQIQQIEHLKQLKSQLIVESDSNQMINNEDDNNEDNNEIENEKKKIKPLFFLILAIILIIILGQIAYIIAGSVFFYDDYSITDSEFDNCRGSKIYYSTLFVVLTTSIFFVGHRISIVSLIAGLITFGFNIWSIIEYAWVTDECEVLLKGFFPQFFNYFEATAILSMIYLCLLYFVSLCICIGFVIYFRKKIATF
eukprot:TRINITY_DN320_c0_g3_i2.p1 TRINITY_DN320_c0_g3~~TRINITY_DN320_c0_g3_i2.p1  ORF type:complete len:437 (+),score=122.11 TRINITY_DN320_c0_g3_i2:79-1389(+)